MNYFLFSARFHYSLMFSIMCYFLLMFSYKTKHVLSLTLLVSYHFSSPLLVSYLNPSPPTPVHSSSSWYWATWPCQTSAVWPRAVSCCTSTAVTRYSTPSWVCSLTGPGWVTPPWDTCRAAAPSSRGSTCPGPATVEPLPWRASAGQTISGPRMAANREMTLESSNRSKSTFSRRSILKQRNSVYTFFCNWLKNKLRRGWRTTGELMAFLFVFVFGLLSLISLNLPP